MGLETLTNAKKGSENREHLIPLIKKPVIRIEADEELVAIDEKIGTEDLKQRGEVPDDFKFEFEEGWEWDKFKWGYFQTGVIRHEDGTVERPFDKLKAEYLRLPGFEFVTPVYGVIPKYEDWYVWVKGVVLTYRSERDLTLSQLDELLTAIVEKLRIVVSDLGLEMSVIRKITVQGYREPGIVFDVFDEILELIKYVGCLENPKSDQAISKEVDSIPDKMKWFLQEVEAKYESEPVRETLVLLAEKLDSFRNLLMGKNRRY
jgi:hypothetical protein